MEQDDHLVDVRLLIGNQGCDLKKLRDDFEALNSHVRVGMKIELERTKRNIAALEERLNNAPTHEDLVEIAEGMRMMATNVRTALYAMPPWFGAASMVIISVMVLLAILYKFTTGSP